MAFQQWEGGIREEASSLPTLGDDRDLEVGEEEKSDEDQNPRHRRASWRDIVGDNNEVRLATKPLQTRGAGSPRGRIQTPTPTRPSPQRLYTREEVAAMIRDNNLRGGAARALMAGLRSSLRT